MRFRYCFVDVGAAPEFVNSAATPDGLLLLIQQLHREDALVVDDDQAASHDHGHCENERD